MEHGAFVISLDFEQYWGMRDCVPLEQYRQNLLGVREAIPAMLKLFAEFEIQATWATVGMLFCESREEILELSPSRRPQYRDSRLSPYADLPKIGQNEEADPYHFALSLIRQIANTPGQEIGTHTFSHYYARAEGQDADAFEADLQAAICVGARRGLRINSIVFPRNQVNDEYLPICRKLGITSYRGEYRPSSRYKAVRLLAGDNITRFPIPEEAVPMNLCGSIFFPPHRRELRGKMFNELTLLRMLWECRMAARKGMMYHVWWHPDNFGVNLDENLGRLRRLLRYVAHLRERYGFVSWNMGELADQLAAPEAKESGLAEVARPPSV